jgi:hypothetical protein
MKIILYLMLLVVLLGGVYADTNGVWHYAKDVRPGVFGENEDSDGNFSFMNNVGIETNTPVSKLQVGSQILHYTPVVSINSENMINPISGQSRVALRLKGSNLGGTGTAIFIAHDANDNEIFKLDGEGNVGIGTNSPVSKLQVGPQIGADEPLVTINAQDKPISALRIKGSKSNPDAAPFVVFKGDSVGGDPAFKIEGNGNVGIGTKNPSAPIDIVSHVAVGGSNIGNEIGFRWSGKSINGINPDSGKVWIEYGPQEAPLLMLEDYDNPPRIQFQQVLSGTETAPAYKTWIGLAGDKTNNFAIMGGDVGIGTTQPQSKLDIDGDIRAEKFCFKGGGCLSVQ